MASFASEADDRRRSMTKPPLSNPVVRATSDSTGGAPRDGFPADLGAELSVSNIQASLSFWRDLLGFDIAYDRPDARFAYLVRGRLQVMLCELNGRWETADMQRPFGRGINFQMVVDPYRSDSERARPSKMAALRTAEPGLVSGRQPGRRAA